MTEDTVKRLMWLADEYGRAAYVDDDKKTEAARSALESALREALLPAPLPTGWLIADDIAAAKLRWAAHVFGSIAPPNHERVPYSSALNDLRSALSRMSAAPSATTAPAEVPLPTSAEPMGDVMARLSKTPAEAYERGYLDGFAKAQEDLRSYGDARVAAALKDLGDAAARPALSGRGLPPIAIAARHDLRDGDPADDVIPTLPAGHIWCCGNGCGDCRAILIPFEYSRTETLEGELLESRTSLVAVSHCCKAPLTIWDEVNDTEGPEPDFRGKGRAA